MNIKEFKTEAEIEKVVEKLAQQLIHDFASKKPIFICILDDSAIFFSDLIKRINIICEFDFLRIKRHSTGEIKWKSFWINSLRDKHVVLIKMFINDKGLMDEIISNIESKTMPKSIKVVSLIKSKDCEFKPDYCTYEISNEYYLMGYGLTSANGRNGNLKGLNILKKVL